MKLVLFQNHIAMPSCSYRWKHEVDTNQVETPSGIVLSAQFHENFLPKLVSLTSQIGFQTRNSIIPEPQT